MKLLIKLAFSMLLIACLTGEGRAVEPYKEWWKFLKGEWSYDISPVDDTGTVTWRLAAKGNALIGRFVADNGTVANELAGWHVDKGKQMVHGYSSDGGYWVIEITKYAGDTFEGDNHGVLPDGRPIQGRFVGKKVDADHYEWNFTGKDSDGEPVTMTGKYERKK